MLKSKYYKIYNQIIDRRIQTPLPEGVYGENHHIIPKSIGGIDDCVNIVKLSAREHYICHYLLTKFTENVQYHKMIKAFDAMQMKGKGQNNRYNSILFEQNRIKAARAHSIMMTGKKQKPEHIKQRALSNTGKVRSKETKALMSIKQSGELNPSAKVWEIYNSNGKLVEVFYGAIKRKCDERNWPCNAFRKSNGSGIYTNLNRESITRLINLDWYQYKGWYAINKGLVTKYTDYK